MSFQLFGPRRQRVRSLWSLTVATGVTGWRSVTRTRRLPTWPWLLEAANEFTRRQMQRAMSRATSTEARAVLNSLTLDSGRALPVRVIPSTQPKLPGHWLYPASAVPQRGVLYLHGGGYAFYARAHLAMMKQVALASRSVTFALDYRLAPEHPFPAQLDDALAAYQALLAQGTSPARLVLAGDSAGGHLMLSLLRRLRELSLPLPALAIGLCPWTSIGDRSPELSQHDGTDWISSRQTLRFGRWAFGANLMPDDEAISPVAFDLRGFPPLYLQAGGREVLWHQIDRFAIAALRAGVDVTLDVWPEMTHDFQAFGPMLPESEEALQRIGAMVDHYLGPDRRTRAPMSPRTTRRTLPECVSTLSDSDHE